MWSPYEATRLGTALTALIAFQSDGEYCHKAVEGGFLEDLLASRIHTTSNEAIVGLEDALLFNEYLCFMVSLDLPSASS